MNKLLLTLTFCLTIATFSFASNPEDGRDLYSDSWVATDAIGRDLPIAKNCPSPRKDKFVGIFYWSWHHPNHGGPRDISKILAEAKKTGEEPKWQDGIGASHFWGEPELGYYINDDPYISRKHASMLCDAGIDVIIFDTTNTPYTFKDQYTTICETYLKIRNEGGRTPQVMFLAPFGSSQDVVNKIFADLYSKNLYKDLWFIWDGKPLVLADPKDFSDNKKISKFFTFRKPIGTYFNGPTGVDQWSWSNDSYHPDAMFVDQYNQEYSRDIEPMKGGHSDTYYYQMISNIRKFKGMRKPQKTSCAKTINIDGTFDEWKDVAPEYRDTLGDNAHRNFRGYGKTHYTNTTGRNDIIASKVAVDKKNIYFYVKTNGKLSPYTDKNWMMLFIDADQNKSSGWEGFDYLINSGVIDAQKTTIKSTSSGWNWNECGKLKYKVSGNEMEIAVPRKMLNMERSVFDIFGSEINFDFHWADNIQKDNDIIEFSISGDSAPNRRFDYRYKNKI